MPTSRAARSSRGKARLRARQRGRRADLEAVAGLALAGRYVPKVAGAGGRASDRLPVHCLIESAAGVEAAYEIARTPGVAGISLGEADLRSETGASRRGSTGPAAGSSTPRSPPGCRARRSRSTRTCDLDGLAPRARGRELGHLGRGRDPSGSAPVIEQAYLPTDEEVEQSPRDGRAARAALGAATLEDGASWTPRCSALPDRSSPWPSVTGRRPPDPFPLTIDIRSQRVSRITSNMTGGEGE